MGSLKTKVFSYTISLATVVTSLFGGLSFASSTITASAATTTTSSTTTGDYNLATNVKDGVILHAFCWSFNEIKNHMKDIAAAGFSAVQTSPAQATYNGAGGAMQLWNSNNNGGGHWWWAYQPTDERLGNWQFGTRDEFAAMCAEAKKYGVKIVVDVVANHTTGTLSAVSSNLASVGGGLGQGQLYHSQGFTFCQNWNNRWNIVQQEMSNGLPDIDTEKQSYQDYLISYLNDCITCGASGFRFDGAKHIGLPDDSGGGDFWPEVTGNRVGGGGVFEYGESLQDGNGMDRLGAYSNYLNVTASNYGGSLRSAIQSSNLNTNTILYSNSNGAPDSKLVKWVESHDNYCNEGSNLIDNQKIMWGWAAIAARKDGTGLYFDRPAGSSTSNQWGNNLVGPMGDTTFENPQVAEVNKFRNAMIGQTEYLRNPNGNNQVLMVERGGKGVVIINTSSSTLNLSSATTLANGTYTDQISKRTFTVSGGTITGTVDAGKIAVVYNPTIVTTPKATISQEGGTFSNSLALTLGYTNATSGTYSINGSAAQSYTNGQTITIGASAAVGSTITVALTATNGTATDNESYTFTKVDTSTHVAKPGMASIALPSGWGAPNIYVYDDSGSTVKEVAAWPGVAMTQNGSGIYSYTLPSGWTTAKVIFNYNGQQIPGANQPGFALTNTEAMIYKDGSWQTDSVARTVVAGMASIELPSGWGTPNIYVYDDSGSTVKTIAAWPGVAMTQNGTNIYSYTLPSGWTTAKVLFNYNGQQIPGANQPGFVLTNTEAMIYKNGSWQNDPIS